GVPRSLESGLCCRAAPASGANARIPARHAASGRGRNEAAGSWDASIRMTVEVAVCVRCAERSANAVYATRGACSSLAFVGSRSFRAKRLFEAVAEQIVAERQREQIETAAGERIRRRDAADDCAILAVAERDEARYAVGERHARRPRLGETEATPTQGNL